MPDHDVGASGGGNHMGMVISFPATQRQSARMESAELREAGQVVILPVIRVERTIGGQPTDALDGTHRTPGRKRRRRISRS